MTRMRGYYSLVQYCPDLSRLEAANVGVLLVCPEVRFADVHLAEGHDRVRRFFRSENVDFEALDAAKKAIRNRVRLCREDLTSESALEQFVDTRSNEVILTPLRPVKVDVPSETLLRLFKELVGARRTTRARRFRELDEAFQRPSLFGRVHFRQQVTIPIVGRRIHAPYAYQNGSLNLVKPEDFSERTITATNAAMRLAIEGDLLNRHPVEGGRRATLVVVGDFHRTSSDVRERVFGLFAEYRVRAFDIDRIEDLVQEVETTAH